MKASLSAVLLLLLQGAPPLDQVVCDTLKVPSGHRSPRADDAEFLRRLSLDLLGYPPNAEQAAAFLADRTPDKRDRAIDDLLSSVRFADSWSRRFAEVFFGNYAEPTFDVSPGLPLETRRRLLGNFIAWLREQIRDDRPWPDLVREILTARGGSESVPQIAYKLSFEGQEPQELQFADGVTRHFMGLDLHCARCHDHPFDRWRIEDFHSFAAFNARQRATRTRVDGVDQVLLSYVEPRKKEAPLDPGIVVPPTEALPEYFGRGPGLGEDLPKALAAFILNDPKDYVHQALANRVWSWLTGRGIYEPVDSLNLRHKPLSPPLLQALTATLRAGNGSLKALVRAICRTEAYQRTSAAEGKCGKAHYCRAEVIALSGEQLINSIQVALRGAPGLDLDEARELTAALSMRPRVGCEVQPLPCTTLHALMFRNSERLWDWIRRSPVLAGILKSAVTDADAAGRLFLAVLSRPPSSTERDRFERFLHDRGAAGLWDACWILMNTAEFLTRH